MLNPGDLILTAAATMDVWAPAVKLALTALLVGLALFVFDEIRRLLDENERLRAQIRMLAPVVNAALRPTGEHRIVDGYCPDCGGSCLVGFGNPPETAPLAPHPWDRYAATPDHQP